MNKKLFFVIALLLAVSAAGFCFSRDYLIGPGDVLNIIVYDNDDLKTKVRVGDDGKIVMPLIGQVDVKGLTITQVTDRITERLADGYLVNPQVNVFIEEFRSKKVVILGKVRKPGLVELSGPISFVELVSKAGGLEKDAGETATIKRKVGGKDEVIVIDLLSLIEGRDLSQNVPIFDGDTVVIAKSGMCYVTGEVKSPGSYPCGEDSTVLKLVTLAEGFTGKASKSSVDIIRIVDEKKTRIEDVDLDFSVQHNDVIVVPESFF